MPDHRTPVRLRDMLAYAEEALSFTQGRVRDNLGRDMMFSFALVRALEVIGEAASQIPAEDRALYPDIPWSVIIRFRNRLIHGYFSIDYDVVWQVVTQDLTPLIASLRRITAP